MVQGELSKLQLSFGDDLGALSSAAARRDTYARGLRPARALSIVTRRRQCLLAHMQERQ